MNTEEAEVVKLLTQHQIDIKILHKQQLEANNYTNSLKPFGLSLWKQTYITELMREFNWYI